ncbi:alpha/beta fold hydrolase [Stakelama tenebrarum]|uniref:Alpha/beta fold hydrolase n=1 Tax=Stakelama tenebrarum TaxID=2711215 RepID=A0A6G6Y763_9SPHN|nr:alpha/beta fold hydrolase [Sphingosinithalassobacter tenebrarum]QIG80749.1 alpha/beta fold hydrolase [Sphingosinithalassobacter tenebrarum]
MADLSHTDFEVAVPGGAIHAELYGEAPTIAFIHGLSGSTPDWDRIWRALPEGMSGLRIDLRDHGRSRAEPGVSYSAADDLAAVLDAARVDRCAVVGMSHGGAVAANFAIEHPDRTSSLILISPALFGWEWSDEWRADFRPIIAHARAGDLETAKRLWWNHPLFEKVRERPEAAELAESIARFDGRPWLRDDHRRVLPDVERLHLIKAPSLLLSGTQDVAEFRLIADLIASTIPDLCRIDVPGAGHMLTLEAPERAAAEISRFLDPTQSPG